jgi:putative transposase
VLARKVSNTLETGFCVAALNEALAKYGTPEIFNTDQGAQFTSEAFLSVLEGQEITISMDGRGRALDNVFVERLWRSVKYECVYPKAVADGHALNRGLAEYFVWYNTDRPHQGLDGATPDEVCFAGRSLQEAA